MRPTLFVMALVLLGCAGSGASHLTPSDGALVGSDGGEVQLAEIWRGHPATVLVWWSSSCPCVARYRDRVHALADAYGARDVAFYYVASNADDGPDEVLEASRQLSIPIVRDQGGALAQRLGVISTPTVAVVDREGAVRFLGWLDNEHAPGEAGREAWLESALDGLLSGGQDTQRTPVFGCRVTRSLSEPAGKCKAPHEEAPAAAPSCGGTCAHCGK